MGGRRRAPGCDLRSEVSRPCIGRTCACGGHLHACAAASVPLARGYLCARRELLGEEPGPLGQLTSNLSSPSVLFSTGKPVTARPLDLTRLETKLNLIVAPSA